MPNVNCKDTSRGVVRIATGVKVRFPSTITGDNNRSQYGMYAADTTRVIQSPAAAQLLSWRCPWDGYGYVQRVTCQSASAVIRC